MFDLFPFEFSLQADAVAGTALWSLAGYWALSPLKDWIVLRLQQWFNFAERSLYLSQAEFDRTKVGRESQNAFFASMFSIVPFLVGGGLLHYWVDHSLGEGWSISCGMLGSIVGGIYELGRRQAED